MQLLVTTLIDKKVIKTKILTSIIVSGIFYYICYWVTKDDSTRELIFASLIAITILILCILELLGVISF